MICKDCGYVYKPEGRAIDVPLGCPKCRVQNRARAFIKLHRRPTYRRWTHHNRHLRDPILWVLQVAGARGLTNWEIHKLTGATEHSVSLYVNVFEKKGLVIKLRPGLHRIKSLAEAEREETEYQEKKAK